MSEAVSQRPIGVEERAGMAQRAAPLSVASLLPFPPTLQEVFVEAVLKTAPERATDIWYEDEETDCVVVMRHNMQWYLNETASALWLRLGKSMKEIVDELYQEYPDSDPREIQFFSVEFLLRAASYGLVDFFPETGVEQTKTKRS